MGVGKWLITGFLMIFLVGWLANYVTSGEVLTEGKMIISAPGDHISEDQILVYPDKVVLDVQNARWAKFTPTGSMLPFISENANTIELVPSSPEQLNVGDAVAYRSKYAEGIIIHRIIEIGYDDEGWYCIVQGDSLKNPDPGKIRFDQIEAMVIAVIY